MKTIEDKNGRVECYLAWGEYSDMMLHAVRRQWYNMKHAKGDRGDKKIRTDPWALHIQGAGAEYVVAHYLNRFWPPPLGKYKAIDIRPDIEVRSTVANNPTLRVSPKDHDATKVVLVQAPKPGHFDKLAPGRADPLPFIIYGYILAMEGRSKGMKSGWGDGGETHYVVSILSLKPIKELLT